MFVYTYRPLHAGTGDPQWYDKPNPAGTPAHLPHHAGYCASAAEGVATAALCRPEARELPFALAHSGDDIYSLWKHDAEHS